MLRYTFDFFFHFQGGSSNEEDLKYHVLHYEILKKNDSVGWNDGFSNSRSIAYSIFAKDMIQELVRAFTICFVIIYCLR